MTEWLVSYCPECGEQSTAVTDSGCPKCGTPLKNKDLPEYDENTLRKLLVRSELEHGVYYVGRCRNATVARWNAKEGCFYHWREKFDRIFIETIKHPIDEGRFDVFRPVRVLSEPKFEIPFDDTSMFGGTNEDLREYESEMWKREGTTSY